MLLLRTPDNKSIGKQWDVQQYRDDTASRAYTDGAICRFSEPHAVTRGRNAVRHRICRWNAKLGDNPLWCYATDPIRSVFCKPEIAIGTSADTVRACRKSVLSKCTCNIKSGNVSRSCT